MEMVDLKLPEVKNEVDEKCTISAGEPCEGPRYPYGMQLRFENEQIEKLPSLLDYRVGDKILITAEATITEVRMVERQKGKEDNCVEAQIEQIACEPKADKKPEEMNLREYKRFRSS